MGDLLAAGGDEVPPDIARPVQRRPAKRHQPRALRAGGDGDLVAGAEDHHPPGLEAVAGNADAALGDVYPAILVIVGQRKARAGGKRHVEIEGLGIKRGRCLGPIGAAEDQRRRDPLGLEAGQGLLAVMLEDRVHLLAVLGQGDPGLDAVKAVRPLPAGGRGALGMSDALAGHHPVHRAGQDHLIGADTVAMMEIAAIEKGDGAQPDMRMRPDVDALTGQEFRRTGLIEEDERPDHLALRGGQGALDLEAAEIAGARNNRRLDGVEADFVGVTGAKGGVPAHVLSVAWIGAPCQRFLRRGRFPRIGAGKDCDWPARAASCRGTDAARGEIRCPWCFCMSRSC